jgi:FkbM family methyltransferase
MADDHIWPEAFLEGLNLSLRRLSSKPRAPAAVRTLAKATAMAMTFLRHPVGKKHVVRTLGRELAWQVWRRVLRSPVAVTFHDGSTLVCPHWSAAGGSLIAVGLGDLAELSFLQSVLRPEEFLFDVGANIGVYSIVAARHGARVLAFEPSQRARDVLITSTQLNQVDGRITCLPFALSDRNATARFTSGLDVGNHLIEEANPTAGNAATEVEVRRLDDLLAGMPDALVPRLIKVDVEGADLDVLRGAEQTLMQTRPFVIIEVWDGGHDVRAWLEERGYKIYGYDREARVLRDLPTDFRRWQANFICVHESRIEEARELLGASAHATLRPPSVGWLHSFRTRSAASVERET